MVIHGIGADIIEINRIQKALYRHGNRLAMRILSPSELEKYYQHKQKIRFLAKHFAVKEAASKAFGWGIHDGLAFSQFELFNNRLGKPMLRLFSQAAVLADQLSISSMHVSLTDERNYAYAVVILER